MKFTEAQLEKAIIELLDQEGFPHVHGANIVRNDDEVLIKEDIDDYNDPYNQRHGQYAKGRLYDEEHANQ